MKKLNNIFDMDTIKFVSYKNSNSGPKDLEYKIVDDYIILDIDVEDNVCIKLSIMFNELFQTSGDSFKIKVKTDEVIDTKENEDSAIIVRAQAVSKFLEEGKLEEKRERENQAMLIPNEDMEEEVLNYNLNGVEKLHGFTLHIWGAISGTPLNNYRKCQLQLNLEDFKISDTIFRDNSIENIKVKTLK